MASSGADEESGLNPKESSNEDMPVSSRAAFGAAIFFIILCALVAWGTNVIYPCIIAFGIQYVVFLAYAWPFHSEKFYDFTGACTFISVMLFSFIYEQGYKSIRGIVLFTFVIIWTSRLGSFLFMRIRADGGQDRRFDPIRNNFARFFMSWTLQGVWVFWCTLPVTWVHLHANDKTSLYPTDYIGWFVWLFGFVFEVISDRQKTHFKENPENRGKFINTGLWSISRHPNYFGEIVLWIGITISAASVARNFGWLMILSPLWTIVLLCFASGIPLTEKRADTKYGDNPDYLEYKRNTSVLIPFCPLCRG